MLENLGICIIRSVLGHMNYVTFLFNLGENKVIHRLSTGHNYTLLFSWGSRKHSKLQKHESSTYFLSFPDSWCHVLEIVRLQLFHRILLCCHTPISSFNLDTGGCIFIPGSPLLHICLNVIAWTVRHKRTA